MKKLLALVFGVLVISNISLASKSRLIGKAAWIDRLHPLQDAALVTTPEDQHTQIIQALQAAKSHVAMSIYHLTDTKIIEVLINLAGKGVLVQVLLDASSLQNPKYKAVYDQLLAAKVQVSASSPLFRITHTKSFVVDDRLAFISTMNLVGHYSEMRDYGLFTQDQDIVRELNSVFQADLLNAKNSAANTPPLSNANLLWSPVNAEAKLVDLINFANSSIAVIVENIGKDTAVVNALVEARKRGVIVQVLTPECDLNPNPLFNYPALYQLAQAGAENRIAPYPTSAELPYMHAKVIVVDHRLAFLGSENFSYSSLTLSREVGVVFANVKTIKALESYISKDWSVGKALPTTPTTLCPKMSLLEL